jgi:acetyl-CoA carboxylase, biotin carboxylase subunit
MITSLFIANRGEIAVRIIRTCREMGIRTVAAYSQADSDSLPVMMADAAVCVGPPATKDSYTHKGNLISAALYACCDAIHPGVGFLSENAEFAAKVQEAGLLFIGPEPRTISFLGNKVHAKKTAAEAGLPVIPGSDGSIEDLKAAKGFAGEVGYPVIIKAASGGGGKGMRIVRDAESLERNMKIAAHEAQTAFSDGTIYMEKYLENPRHVEVQILADTHGNVIHLGERDCSLQRNHQKLVEESPSPAMDERLRDKMCRDAVTLFAKLDYKGAGTVEFLFDGKQYFFMEVNARVQVEHPVSELVSGIDIIREQIRACSGESLKLSQEEIGLEGASIECRINALSPGRVSEFFPPGGRNVRFDSYLYQGYTVPSYYDALLGKLITYGSSRRSAVNRMGRALNELRIGGISTNIEEQKRIIDSNIFRGGVFGTYDLAKILEE